MPGGRGPPKFVNAPKLDPDYQLRLFRNTPFWRYGDDMAVHEHFPRKGRGRGKKLVDEHLFHYSFVLMSREEREANAAEYTGIDESTGSTSDMYLWEESGVGGVGGGGEAVWGAADALSVRPAALVMSGVAVLTRYGTSHPVTRRLLARRDRG